MKKKIKLFRKQHQELLVLVGEISELLEKEGGEWESERIFTLLKKLSREVKGHLATEDMELYPKLLARKDTNIRRIALDFFCDISELGFVFEQYQKKWSGEELIRLNPKTFTQESRKIFEALNERIQNEESAFFPLFDKN
ncbi:MAG: hemerythrin domain-containing protein [Magnetococcales bacterium]|nr:hemerythrin domain-containing protein [Magnetococcales bacterium]